MPIPKHVKEGFKRSPSNKINFVFHKTATFTLDVFQTGGVFTNLGAAGSIVANLPVNATGKKGLEYTFVVMAAQTLTIDPGSAGAIYIGGAKQSDDETISSTSIGDSITLVSDGNGDWIVAAREGSWGQPETVSGDNTFSGTTTFSGQVDHSGTRIEPECISPTAALTLTSAHYGKTIVMTSLCRKVTLPLAAAGLDGVCFTLVNMHNATADATEAWVDPVSGDKINGGTTGIGLRGQSTADALGDHLKLICDGANWFTVARFGTWAASSAA